ncbi:serine--tRNA ligase [Halobacteriovorax sp. JY17]|uniref:serine--tRNA ligase n=1 Tax=Halobacteriovorax sp. JY17 TaxID=2014617 RepID=UPI000C4A6309|nr:serine--tRNA ligase [Halobacteriovorax sp. JY17]PIK16355.1 MAG: serine--tRNA ligase [Halobacteriovorax sp. JY17]
MLDIKFIRENLDAVKTAAKVKNIAFDFDQLLSLDKEISDLKGKVQELQEKRNSHSKKIPKASAEERPALIEEGRVIGTELDAMKPSLTDKEAEFRNLLLTTPMVPSPLAPIGNDENDNVEVKKFGELPNFDFKPLDHVEILEKQGWAEFEKIASVSGSRSYSLRNDMVLLEMAMHRYALEKLQAKGFTLVSTPSLAREEALVGTGHFPTGKDQVYYLPDDDLYLSGTAEVQLNSLHAKDILTEDKLPILYAGYSPCFRREAGSYGRDVRGLIRVHQFMKVEQYVICKNSAEESDKWHKILLETSEEIVQDFELPYRIVECCTGDMGTGKVRMYDIECWVPSEEKYRETHSCSQLHDWQSRRTNTRYRDSDGKVQFVHTLNNTAVATPRTLVPFLECHQQADGRIKVPAKLRPYLGGQEYLGK